MIEVGQRGSRGVLGEWLHRLTVVLRQPEMGWLFWFPVVVMLGTLAAAMLGPAGWTLTLLAIAAVASFGPAGLLGGVLGPIFEERGEEAARRTPSPQLAAEHERARRRLVAWRVASLAPLMLVLPAFQWASLSGHPAAMALSLAGVPISALLQSPCEAEASRERRLRAAMAARGNGLPPE